MYHQLVNTQRSYFLSNGTRSKGSRRENLENLKKLVEENKVALEESIYLDLKRDCQEVNHVIHCIDRILGSYLDAWLEPQIITSEPYDPTSDTAYVIRDPLGVVLIISPWNVPIYCSLPYVASAFAAGNTVILKPSEYASNYSKLIGELVQKYFDEKVFTVVEGAVAEVTSLLTERFDGIVYTGSPAIGRIVMGAAAKNLTPVILELGGKNPVFVDSSADLEDAAEKIVFSKLFNAGQACISSDYILTTEQTKKALIAALKSAFEKHEPLRENPLFSRIINEIHYDRLRNLQNTTEGCLVLGGTQEDSREEKYIAPKVYTVAEGDSLLKEEIFGPLVSILTVPSFKAALDYINSNEKPLAAYIFTKDADQAARFIKETHSGGVTVNDVMKQVFLEHGPFGGVGNSGMGKVNGKFAFDNLTHARSILIRNGLKLELDI